jgi:WD40 repeat protein
VLLLKNTRVALNCLAFSPDGKLLAAGGYKGEAQLWDTATGALTARLPGRRHSINGVFFFDGGAQLAGYDDTVFTWGLQRPDADAQEWKATRERTRGVAVTADGQWLCLELDQGFRSPNDLACHALPSGKPRWKRKVNGRASPLAFSPDGRVLLHGGRRGAGDERRSFLVLRNASTGEVMEEVACDHPLLDAAALSPDGQFLAWVNGKHLCFWQLDPPRELAHHVSPGRTELHSVAFPPSGNFFATANGDGTVDYWDGRTGAHRRAYDWKVGKLHDVVFDPAGDRAACCSKTGQIVIWDVDE